MNNSRNIQDDKFVIDPLYVSTQELCCPVCSASLANNPPSPQIHAIEGHGKKETAMRNEIREVRAGRFRDAELVVAAPCGHIFHRFCLRHYCFVFQKANNIGYVECPVCNKDLSMVKFQAIDYKAHFRASSKFEQFYTKTVFTNQELHEQRDATMCSLENTEKALVEAKIKLEAYRSHQKNMSTKERSMRQNMQEQTRLRNHIEKCNQGIDAMHKENLNIIKMYLSIMKDQPEELLHDKRIPEPLIPYLAIILADEELVKKFGEILKPVEIDGLRSNTELLIKEILADVVPKAHSNGKLKKVEKRRNTLKPTGKPVVVKVQRSKVSIFSRSALDQESLKTILLEVKGPINKLHDTHHKLATKDKKDGRNKESSYGVRRSVSDIQVLLEPRKTKPYESGSGQPLESDADFVKSLPPRRCKSTNPILMKARGRKTVVVKVNELKQVEHRAVGDGKDTVPLQPEVNKENVGSKTLNLSSPPTAKCCRVSIHDMEEKAKAKISSKDFKSKLQFGKSRNEEESNEAITNRLLSAGFTPNVSGSVYEMTSEKYGVDVDNSLPLTSLVDDVSKINFREVPCQNGEDDGNVREPILEYSVLLPKKVTTSTNTENHMTQEKQNANINEADEPQDIDIENAWRASEFTHDNGRSTSRKTSGLLQGILPGPFLSSASGQQASYLTENVPLYQSKWLTKLPSTRTDCNNAQQNSLDQCSNVPRNYRRADEIVGNQVFETIGTKNQPYVDGQESRHFSITSLKHTVIDIPGSNTMISMPPLRNNNVHQLMSRRIQRPISPLRYPPPQSSYYNLNNNYRNVSSRLRQSQQISFNMGFSSNSDLESRYVNSPHTNYWNQQEVSPQNQRFHNFNQTFQAINGDDTYESHMQNGRKQFSRRMSQGVAVEVPNHSSFEHALVVEHALAELCRGLSPPRDPKGRNTYSGSNLHNEYYSNSHPTHQSFPRSTNKEITSSSYPTTIECSGVSGSTPRLVQRGKRRQHINV